MSVGATVSQPQYPTEREGEVGGAREEEGLPPPRTLAHFLPDSDTEDTSERREEEFTFSSATATCPICGLFEGDEVAVSHHVESHLT